MIHILVQAGEGDTQSIYYGNTKEKLLENINQDYVATLHLANLDDIEYMRKEQLALMHMLEAHTKWESGRYILSPSIPPIWEEWTLVIAV